MPSLSLEALQGLSARLLWLTLLHSLWLGLVVAATVALILQSGRHFAHQTRHTILIVALGFVVVGPILVVGLQEALESPTGVTSPPQATLVIGASVSLSPRPQAGRSNPQIRSLKAESTTRSWFAFPSREFLRAVRVLSATRSVALIVWTSVVGGLGCVLALGTHGVRRLIREAVPASEDLQIRMSILSRRLRLHRRPVVLVHPRIGEPCLCGLFRPLILLPTHWIDTSSQDQLEAVLAHELAHARRGDHLTNVVQRLVEIAFFYHPAVHWLSRSLRLQREYCTDALAVRITKDPLALARALESVARLRRQATSPLPLGAALAGESPSLLPRIQELIGMKPSRPQRHLWPLTALPLAGIFAVVAVSAGWSQTAKGQVPTSASSDATRPANPRAVTIESTPYLYDDFDIRDEEETIRSSPFDFTCILPPKDFRPPNDKQVSFQVQFVSLETKSWKEFMNGRPSAIEDGVKALSWTFDQRALDRFLHHLAPKNPAANLVRCPKVTMFEDMPGLVLSSQNIFIRSGDLTEHKSPKAHESRPIVSKDQGRSSQPSLTKLRAEIKTEVRFKGVSIPQGVRLSVEFHDASLPNITTFDHWQPADSERRISMKAKPSLIEKCGRTSCDIPNGSSLVLSVGTQDQPGASTEGTNAKSRERLIIVTPRAIIVPPSTPAQPADAKTS